MTRRTGSSVTQRSGLPSFSRSQQRVWKRQPDGGLTGDGTSPLRMIRRRRDSTTGSGIGTADSRATVYGWSGRRLRSREPDGLDHAAQVHHRGPVADVADDAQVVGDEQVGQPEVALEPLEQVDDLGLDRDVERADRLVRDDQVGLQGEGPGDADALPLAARELVRIARGVGRVEPDGREQLPDALAALGWLADVVDVEWLGDDPAGGHPRIEAGVRVLEDHLHPLAQAAQLGTLDLGHVLAVEEDPAPRRRVEADDRPPGRALAAARFADEAERLAALDLERDAIDRLDVADVALRG